MSFLNKWSCFQHVHLLCLLSLSVLKVNNILNLISVFVSINAYIIILYTLCLPQLWNTEKWLHFIYWNYVDFISRYHTWCYVSSHLFWKIRCHYKLSHVSTPGSKHNLNVSDLFPLDYPKKDVFTLFCGKHQTYPIMLPAFLPNYPGKALIRLKFKQIDFMLAKVYGWKVKPNVFQAKN